MVVATDCRRPLQRHQVVILCTWDSCDRNTYNVMGTFVKLFSAPTLLKASGSEGDVLKK